MSQNFFERLGQRVQSLDSALCIGLDPRADADVQGEDLTSLLVSQNRALIDATVDVAAAYKPNIAFYEAWGEAGLLALRATLGYIPSDIPIILDAKRGDIGATAEAYARMAFEEFHVDAVTASPYMGFDSLEPFARYEGKGIFVLCKTSNPGANDLQLVNVGPAGETLYQHVADLAEFWGPQYGLVVAGNDAFALNTIRAKHQKIWFLAPGIGVQGGTITDAVHNGINEEGLGILPMVARSIAQASNPKKAAHDLADEYRHARDAALKLHKSRPEPSGTNAHTRPGTPRLVAMQPQELKTRVLRGLIRNACFKTGEFKLKSGEISPFYVDLRRIMSDATLLREVGLAYASLLGAGSALAEVKFDRIAGIPVAGLPLATATCLTTGIPMIFPRMQAKDHGTGLTVEGEFEKGEEVILLDDLITTGKSKLEAIEILKAAGLKVRHLLVLLERGTQGRKDLEAEGVTLHSFAHISEFFPLCQDMGLISPEERKNLEAYAAR